jgi:exosortase/archaeosortase family protein
MSRGSRATHAALRLAPLLVQAFVLWPLLTWYGRRLVRGTVEPWELLALAFGVGAALHASGVSGASAATSDPAPRHAARQLAGARGVWIVAAVGALAANAIGAAASPLAHAVLAVAALACTSAAALFGRRVWLAALAIGLLALPIVPILQLHLGYPLRLGLAHVAAAVVAPFAPEGVAVAASGAGVTWGETFVLVDAPCSGVRLLWTALFVAAALALIDRAGTRRTAALLTLAVAAAVFANLVRTVVLVLLEVGAFARAEHLDLPVVHESLGALLAVLVAATLLAAARFARRRAAGSAPAPVALTSDEPAVPRAAFMALAVAACTPFVFPHEPSNSHTFDAWPTHFEGEPLAPLPPAPEDARLAERFPGALARFAWSRGELVLMHFDEPTADVHAAETCYRGAGFDVVPLPALRAPDGSLWSRFRAARDGQVVVVRERIRDAAGRSWSDPSAWWWSAVLGRTSGPWWRELVAERAP